jgi:chromosome segregation ATPase
MKCLFVVLCLSLFLVFSSGQELSIPLTDSRLVASEPLSKQLDSLALTLEQTLIDSETDWEILSSILTEHSRKLESLAMSSRVLEQESESMQASLKDLETSLAESIREAKRRNLELWIWRGGTVLGISGTIAALAWGHR